jgi:hypothetical protein
LDTLPLAGSQKVQERSPTLGDLLEELNVFEFGVLR